VFRGFLCGEKALLGYLMRRVMKKGALCEA
jgi:hypothetical protein